MTRPRPEAITLVKLLNEVLRLLAEGVPGDTPVIAEGCDCDGLAGGLGLESFDGRLSVRLNRI